tara:strand:+ start:826 stop:1086 length:261 start_codon:yes stop_codon:yes gene_type:complete
MKRKIVTKLYQGKFVSVRDYEVASAIKSGGMEITYQDQKMYLPPHVLQALQPTGKKMKSKIGGKDYYLMDILFKPSKEDPRQIKLI